MTVDVSRLINEVLEKEGGYVDHPYDRGGPTKYGITQATLSKFLERVATVEDVKMLDVDTARDIYELRYYRMPRIDRLPGAIQAFTFDSAVNHGPRRAIKFVQEVCNDVGFGSLTSDGLMGPKTKAMVDACYENMKEWMLVSLVEERQMFYINIVSRDETQKVFLNGWLNRARSFLPEDDVT
jgi:lysozyme family protein